MSLEIRDQITAKIIADSINPASNRVTTFILHYPRFFHSELLTHRALSRNSASSRAIPIEKVIDQVKLHPAKPIRWGKNGKGMQDHGEFPKEEINNIENTWAEAAQSAIESAQKLTKLGLHKQIVNRVLEPFVWMTTLVTATEWQNFFALRVHKDAQPEFQHLAHMMLKNYLSNTPVKREWGDWHIPFDERMPDGLDINLKFKVATARAARVSYLTMDGEINIDKDIALHDSLAENGHWSPFEHTCMAFEDAGIGNFRGWIQYRHTFCEENIKCDLNTLLRNYEEN